LSGSDFFTHNSLQYSHFMAQKIDIECTPVHYAK